MTKVILPFFYVREKSKEKGLKNKDKKRTTINDNR